MSTFRFLPRQYDRLTNRKDIDILHYLLTVNCQQLLVGMSAMELIIALSVGDAEERSYEIKTTSYPVNFYFVTVRIL